VIPKFLKVLSTTGLSQVCSDVNHSSLLNGSLYISTTHDGSVKSMVSSDIMGNTSPFFVLITHPTLGSSSKLSVVKPFPFKYSFKFIFFLSNCYPNLHIINEKVKCFFKKMLKKLLFLSSIMYYRRQVYHRYVRIRTTLHY
jgi:hypothetical protein